LCVLGLWLPNFAWNCQAARVIASFSEVGYVPVITLYTACKDVSAQPFIFGLFFFVFQCRWRTIHQQRGRTWINNIWMIFGSVELIMLSVYSLHWKINFASGLLNHDSMIASTSCSASSARRTAKLIHHVCYPQILQSAAIDN
jgi:hypothetical protein